MPDAGSVDTLNLILSSRYSLLTPGKRPNWSSGRSARPFAALRNCLCNRLALPRSRQSAEDVCTPFESSRLAVRLSFRVTSSVFACLVRFHLRRSLAQNLAESWTAPSRLGELLKEPWRTRCSTSLAENDRMEATSRAACDNHISRCERRIRAGS